ncbi:hypothetical protein HDU87_008267 [Geranomyces variabilis]|uniref:Uncharacterized protein n=1 Tax=Geranomyces variabilis TaxID=109894 RepID=A0AAD5TD27_9FUNG|nr:hypothetical protein HDU87_008267 [Geranomyces variabilis]
MPSQLLDPALAASVYLVRHGERIDQVDPSWAATAENPFDPPLTDLGIEQGKRTGRFIAAHLRAANGVGSSSESSTPPKRIVVLSSPFYRTLQTAVALIEGLPGSPVLELLPALSEWLASNYFPKPLPHEPFTFANRKLEFPSLQPAATPADPLPPYPESRAEMRARFLQATELAIAAHRHDADVLILVSHGAGCQALPEELAANGILSPADLKLASTPYCCVSMMEKKAGKEKWVTELRAETKHLDGLLERTGLEFVVGDKNAKGAQTKTGMPTASGAAASTTPSTTAAHSGAAPPAAGGGPAAQIKKYETFVNDRLRPDLQRSLDARDKVYDTISEYLKLRNQIELLQSPKLTELKTMMDVGCEFFMQAKIPSLQYIYVQIGLDTHAELTFDQALAFINKKEALLLKSAERYTEAAAKIRAQIKMVLTTIEQILQLEKTDEKKPYREP